MAESAYMEKNMWQSQIKFSQSSKRQKINQNDGKDRWYCDFDRCRLLESPAEKKASL